MALMGHSGRFPLSPQFVNRNIVLETLRTMFDGWLDIRHPTNVAAVCK
jgi:hypothetical protein